MGFFGFTMAQSYYARNLNVNCLDYRAYLNAPDRFYKINQVFSLP